MIKMKKYLMKILILVVLCIFVFTPNYSFVEGTEKTFDIDIMDKNMTDKFNPNKNDTSNQDEEEMTRPITKTIKEIVNKTLGILQVFGAFIMVISIAFFGFSFVISGNEGLSKDLGIGRAGGPNAKIKLLDFGRGLLIGSFLLFSSTTLVRFVFNIFLGS